MSKGLAELVSEKPYVIKLKFQPSGKGHSELEEEIDKNENYFYVTERENKCVCCGSKENFLKYNIVP